MHETMELHVSKVVEEHSTRNINTSSLLIFILIKCMRTHQHWLTLCHQSCSCKAASVLPATHTGGNAAGPHPPQTLLPVWTVLPWESSSMPQTSAVVPWCPAVPHSPLHLLQYESENWNFKFTMGSLHIKYNFVTLHSIMSFEQNYSNTCICVNCHYSFIQYWRY